MIQHITFLHQLNKGCRDKKETGQRSKLSGEKGALTDDSVTMLPCRLESLSKQPPELLVRLALDPAEDLDVLEWELERRGLEADVAGRVREHKPKVDVDQMAIAVYEDIAVMPILDL